MRTIDADALMEKVCKNCPRYDCTPDATDTVYGCMFADSVDSMPTIETEVQHGRWIDKGEYAVCSECGGRSGTQYDGVEPISLMTQFCPNCGAKMGEGE